MSFANRFRRKRHANPRPRVVVNNNFHTTVIQDETFDGDLVVGAISTAGPMPIVAQNWDYSSGVSTGDAPVPTPEVVCTPDQVVVDYPSDHVTVCEPAPSYDPPASYDSGSSSSYDSGSSSSYDSGSSSSSSYDSGGGF